MSEPTDYTKEYSYTEVLDTLKEYKPFNEKQQWDIDKLENPPIDINTDILKFLLLSDEPYTYEELKECFDSDTNLLLTTMSAISNRFYSRNINRVSDSKVFTKNEEKLIFTGYSFLRNLYSESKDDSLLALIKSTKENIVHSNLRLVKFCIFKHYPYKKNDISLEDEDLVQETYIALMNACDTFLVEKGFRFSSYADRCIRNYIYNFRNKKSPINTESLDIPENEKIVCPDCLEKTTERKILVEKLIDSFSKLKKKQKDILDLRYGIDNGPTFTLKDISLYYGTSRENIRQIQQNAEKKVRKEMSQKGYKYGMFDID